MRSFSYHFSRCFDVIWYYFQYQFNWGRGRLYYALTSKALGLIFRRTEEECVEYDPKNGSFSSPYCRTKHVRRHVLHVHPAFVMFLRALPFVVIIPAFCYAFAWRLTLEPTYDERYVRSVMVALESETHVDGILLEVEHILPLLVVPPLADDDTEPGVRHRHHVIASHYTGVQRLYGRLRAGGRPTQSRNGDAHALKTTTLALRQVGEPPLRDPMPALVSERAKVFGGAIAFAIAVIALYAWRLHAFIMRCKWRYATPYDRYGPQGLVVRMGGLGYGWDDPRAHERAINAGDFWRSGYREVDALDRFRYGAPHLFGTVALFILGWFTYFW